MAGEAEFQKYSRGCVYRLIHFYGDDAVNESDLYKELGTLTKDRERWETSIPYVSSLLSHDSVKIQAKALWLLGEMGLAYPLSVQDVFRILLLLQQSGLASEGTCGECAWQDRARRLSPD